MNFSCKIILPILLLFALGQVKSRQIQFRTTTKQCHASLGTLSVKYLASKRPYYFNYAAEQNLVYTPEGCTPVKFWYFGRHGTRNPGDDDMILMQTTVPAIHREIMAGIGNGKDNLCIDAQLHLASWYPRPLNLSEESQLVHQGRQELTQIAERYKRRFPNLFPDEFDNTTYFFKHTDKKRTKDSAKAFAEGLFGVKGLTKLWMPVAEDPDPVLKFYDACPKWIQEVDDNPASNIEHDRFVESEPMKRVISSVSRRVGLERNLTLAEITILYTTCGFETAWQNGTTSPWCAIFDLEDFKVLSYREDLEYFWKDGYGYEIDYRQACPPFKDAVQYFEHYLKNPSIDLRKVQGYFSHSGANLKMLARLGLFLSFEMKSSNYETIKDNYTWRSSWIDTMASNMAFTLFECPVNDVVQHKIGFFFQEVPQAFAGCGGRSVCSFDEFRRNLASVVDTCNLPEICAV